MENKKSNETSQAEPISRIDDAFRQVYGEKKFNVTPDDCRRSYLQGKLPVTIDLSDPQSPRVGKPNIALFDFAYSVSKFNLPLIVASDGKMEGLIFMLDTGSVDNVLNTEVYEEFKDDITLLPDVEDCMIADTNKVATKRGRSKIVFCGVESDFTFSIADLSKSFSSIEEKTGIHLSGIIGTQFMVERQWALDFALLDIIVPKEW